MTKTVTGATTVGANTSAIVISGSFHGNVTVTGTVSPGGISVIHSSVGGQIYDTGNVAGGISVDSASKINGAATTVGIYVGAPTFAGGVSNAGSVSGILQGAVGDGCSDR